MKTCKFTLRFLVLFSALWQVSVAATVDIKPQNISVKPKEKAAFHCTLSDIQADDKSVKVSWQKVQNGAPVVLGWDTKVLEPFKKTGRYSISSREEGNDIVFTLHLTDVTPTETGIYGCYLEDGTVKTGTLNVTESVDVRPTQSTVIMLFPTKATITCNPATKVKLYQKNVSIECKIQLKTQLYQRQVYWSWWRKDSNVTLYSGQAFGRYKAQLTHKASTTEYTVMLTFDRATPQVFRQYNITVNTMGGIVTCTTSLTDESPERNRGSAKTIRRLLPLYVTVCLTYIVLNW